MAGAGLGDPEGRTISVLVLGDCHVVVDGRTVAGVPSNFFRIIVYLLLTGDHRTVSRRHLRTLLWPDASRTAASANLRQCMARIRQFQEAEGLRLISGTFSSISIDSKSRFSCDLLDFLAQAERHGEDAAPAACRLYRGDLLSDLPECSAEFEDWLEIRREQVRNRFLDMMNRAIGDPTGMETGTACACARHLLAIDPYNEQAYRTLMLDAARNRNVRRVTQIYAACERHMREDLDLRVSEETKLLWKKLVADAVQLVVLAISYCEAAQLIA